MPLFSLAASGRMSASVLSTCSCSGPARSEPEPAIAILKWGKKNASSLLACSLSLLPWRAFKSVSVPYWARKLKNTEQGWVERWRSREREEQMVSLLVLGQGKSPHRMCCAKTVRAQICEHNMGRQRNALVSLLDYI